MGIGGNTGNTVPVPAGGALSKGAPAGIRAEYNHDLNVSAKFLDNFAVLRDALMDERLLREVEYYELEAKAHKRAFHSLGVGSLFFALIALTSAAIAAITGASIVNVIGRGGVIAEGGSVVALVLMLWNRLGRHRVLWCQAVFCRERIRQWHFQTFLDGQLIGLLAKQPADFKDELDRRWAALQQNLRDGYGMMIAFVRHGSRTDDFFHQPSRYDVSSLAKSVLDALCTLRFEHQLRFGRRKTEPEGELVGFSLVERTNLSESVAAFTLAGAVVVGAFGFVVAVSQAFPETGLFSGNAETASRILAGSALLLAVFSAAGRAYRAGYTLPDESESYDAYCDRIREYKAVFESAKTDDEKFRQLENLEAEAALELRRFIRMKMRATFIF